MRRIWSTNLAIKTCSRLSNCRVQRASRKTCQSTSVNSLLPSEIIRTYSATIKNHIASQCIICSNRMKWQVLWWTIPLCYCAKRMCSILKGVPLTDLSTPCASKLPSMGFLLSQWRRKRKWNVLLVQVRWIYLRLMSQQLNKQGKWRQQKTQLTTTLAWVYTDQKSFKSWTKTLTIKHMFKKILHTSQSKKYVFSLSLSFY